MAILVFLALILEYWIIKRINIFMLNIATLEKIEKATVQ